MQTLAVILRHLQWELLKYSQITPPIHYRHHTAATPHSWLLVQCSWLPHLLAPPTLVSMVTAWRCLPRPPGGTEAVPITVLREGAWVSAAQSHPGPSGASWSFSNSSYHSVRLLRCPRRLPLGSSTTQLHFGINSCTEQTGPGAWS